jgi:phage shock protein PspC (stress-responsive transcriptional regulator)
MTDWHQGAESSGEPADSPDPIAAPTAAMTPPRDEDPGVGSLRRSRSHRMLAGVAGGIAERFDVDVSLVRVAFVVLACAWGAGALIYLAMWALVPAAPRGAGDADQLDTNAEPTPSWLAFLLLAGVLCFGLLVVTSWWGGPRWGGGLGLLWVVLLFGLLVIALRDRSGHRTLRRAVAIVALGCMTLVIVVAGSFLGLVASTGVPMSGGIGERIYQPTTLAQVQRFYRTSIGDMTVDLRQVRFPPSTVRVTASVAVGRLVVEVPPGVVVDVTAHAGVGDVSSSPGDLQSFASLTQVPSPDAKRVLVLVAEVGVGRVDLVRALPNCAYATTC